MTRDAIVGPNGSGKTTLLKAINRELYPVADPRSVFRILGRDSWNVWELRKHIGIVSQDLQQGDRNRRLLPGAPGAECKNVTHDAVCGRVQA